MIALNSQLKCVTSIVTLREAKQINENQFQPIKERKSSDTKVKSRLSNATSITLNQLTIHYMMFIFPATQTSPRLIMETYGSLWRTIFLCVDKHLPGNSCVLDRKCPFGHAT